MIIAQIALYISIRLIIQIAPTQIRTFIKLNR